MEKKSYIATAKTVGEALENAKKELGIDTIGDGYDFEVIQNPKSGFLGIGATPAKVRVFEVCEDECDAEQTQKTEEKQKTAVQNAEKKKEKEKPQVSACEKAQSKGESIPDTNAALGFVRTTLKNLGLSATAEGYVDAEGITRISVTGADATMLIGHHGDTLDSLQYLANLAANREYKSGDKNHNRVTVDIEGYREKREATLRSLARRMASRALKYNKSVMLEPMNPYERRIIHSEIQNIEGVSTNSIGSENNRKVVIYLTDKKKSQK